MGVDGDVHHRVHAEDVKERQGRDGNGVGAGADQVAGDLRPAADVGVGQGGALRRSGGAGGVDDHGAVTIFTRLDLPDRRHPREQAFEIAGRNRDIVDSGRCRSGPRRFVEAIPAEQDLRPGIGQVVFDLAVPEQRIQRHDDTAEAKGGEVNDREIGDVGHQQADPVAGPDSAVTQEACHRSRGTVERRVVDLKVIEFDRDSFGIFYCCRFQLCREVTHVPSGVFVANDPRQPYPGRARQASESLGAASLAPARAWVDAGEPPAQP